MLDTIRRRFTALLHISVRPDDPDETRERKALSIGLALGMALGGLVWGIYCLIGGEPRAAVVPFAYTVCTIFNILYLRASGNDQRFRSFQIFLSLILPFLLLIALGGLRSSGAVIIWSLVAPLGATLFTRRREGFFWFISFILLVIISGLIEPLIARPSNFSAAMITLLYVMNILAPTSLAIVLLFYFLQQRQQALFLLQEAQSRAEAANQAKSTFLANMSHELRSPMNAILGFTQVMLRAPDLQENQRDNLEVILHSGEHLLYLINQVLDLSKVEAGRMELQEQTFDLLAMLDGLREMFSLQAANKGLLLAVKHSPSVPHYVRIDEIKLRQVLINLLNNALKFTQAGGVSLLVDATEPAGERLELQFAVEDSGPGIAPEELEDVFAAFAQTETGLKAGGAGLGLPISRQLVRLMGGDLQVSSRLGEGSCFRFHVQANLAAGSQVKHDEEQRAVIGLAAGQPQYRVLIVDDEWANREALFRLLDPLGFPLRQAE
ncbi:MAG: ATP-binding protein, partial [Candidatus Promineifilaceae bacterium]|nr:ATP-binding protein [Candidatus Promineifilaceae bacterium]